MQQLTDFLFQETQHEKEQKLLKKFIPDIPGLTNLPVGHVPQLSDHLFFKNKNIYISKHSRYAPYPIHSHQFLEINYMYHGTCQQMINGQKVTLNTGDILLLDTGSTHSIDKLNSDDIMCNLLFSNQHISLDWLNHLKSRNNLFYHLLLNSTQQTFNENHQYLHISYQATNNKIPQIMSALMTEYFMPTDFSESMIEHYLPILFYEIARCLPNIPLDAIASQLQGPYQEILSLIDTQYESITLTEAAKQLNFNKNYLSNLVKKASGLTFTELVNHKKIQKAKLLIESTALPINEIAQHVGFSNRTYFYKKYFDIYHKMPSEERKS